MPWCPECGAEFVPGITICSDCQVPLQAEPPVKEEIPKEAMVPVFQIEDPIQGTILQSILKESDIICLIQCGCLVVPRDEAEAADFIISEYLNSLDMGEMPESWNPDDSDENLNP